jgi:cellulose synthase/poly-beta-1,6-N-acetylglucosamine synthase-like glycosyltransferase
MRIAFFVALFWLVYVYAGYALALAIVALWKRVRPVLSEKSLPLVSVLIAARNEAKDIGWKISETLAWDYPAEKLEILVASDASVDSTDEVVRGFDSPRVTFVRMERRGGKVRALNRLAEQARGEVLFFTDANAHIGPRALRLMVRHFADPLVGCVTGDSRSIKEIGTPAVSSGAGVYLGYESILKRLENSIGSVLVCDGAIFCMRSALYQRLSPDLANDLELPMRLGAAGYWVTHEPEALVFERDTSSPLEEFKRRRRMCAQGMLAMHKLRGAFRGLRGWQFVSHKLLRWLSLIPMLVVLGSSAALAPRSVLFGSVVAFQVIFYGLAAFGLARAIEGRPIARTLAVPFYIMLGVAGAFVGVVESFLGKRFDVWEIPTLSRGPTV